MRSITFQARTEVTLRAGRTQSFVCGSFLPLDSAGNGRVRLYPAAALSEYTITTQTGSVRGAGTDAHVYIDLWSANGCALAALWPSCCEPALMVAA